LMAKRLEPQLYINSFLPSRRPTPWPPACAVPGTADRRIRRVDAFSKHICTRPLAASRVSDHGLASTSGVTTSPPAKTLRGKRSFAPPW